MYSTGSLSVTNVTPLMTDVNNRVNYAVRGGSIQELCTTISIFL